MDARNLIYLVILWFVDQAMLSAGMPGSSSEEVTADDTCTDISELADNPPVCQIFDVNNCDGIDECEEQIRNEIEWKICKDNTIVCQITKEKKKDVYKFKSKCKEDCAESAEEEPFDCTLENLLKETDDKLTCCTPADNLQSLCKYLLRTTSEPPEANPTTTKSTTVKVTTIKPTTTSMERVTTLTTKKTTKPSTDRDTKPITAETTTQEQSQTTSGLTKITLTNTLTSQATNSVPGVGTTPTESHPGQPEALMSENSSGPNVVVPVVVVMVCVVGILLVIVGIIYWRRKKKNEREFKTTSPESYNNAVYNETDPSPPPQYEELSEFAVSSAKPPSKNAYEPLQKAQNDTPTANKPGQVGDTVAEDNMYAESADIDDTNLVLEDNPYYEPSSSKGQSGTPSFSPALPTASSEQWADCPIANKPGKLGDTITEDSMYAEAADIDDTNPALEDNPYYEPSGPKGQSGTPSFSPALPTASSEQCVHFPNPNKVGKVEDTIAEDSMYTEAADIDDNNPALEDNRYLEPSPPKEQSGTPGICTTVPTASLEKNQSIEKVMKLTTHTEQEQFEENSYYSSHDLMDEDQHDLNINKNSYEHGTDAYSPNGDVPVSNPSGGVEYLQCIEGGLSQTSDTEPVQFEDNSCYSSYNVEGTEEQESSNEQASAGANPNPTQCLDDTNDTYDCILEEPNQESVMHKNQESPEIDDATNHAYEEALPPNVSIPSEVTPPKEGNYIYTYSHFPEEGRLRETKHDNA